jgi:hypothetical protein
VRDVNGGSIGTSVSWVEVPKIQNGKKLITSSIFFGKESETLQSSASGGKASRPALVVGPASFKNSEPVFYRFVVYNVPADQSDMMLKVEVLQSGTSIYESAWQPLRSRVIRADATGVEVAGQLKMDAGPGVYTMRVTIQDSKSKRKTIRTAEFECE